MLTISGITKSFGPRTLFEDATLQVNRGDRIALVGPNGAGKSTLFSLAMGLAEPDTGTVSLQRGASIGHLPQETAPVGNETVLEVATSIPAETAAFLGHSLAPKAKTILNGLAFRERDFHRPVREMSGGWIMRAHLARLLVQQPDLLLLDEPTNHLDLASLQWFQQYLLSYPGAILLISHDREFLNRLSDSIVEIRLGRLHRYRGNYDAYLVQREALAEQQLAAFKNQQKKIDQLQEFVDRFGAKASKAAQAQAKLKQIDRMEKIEAPVKEGRSIAFKFPQPARSGLKVITLQDIHHAYGETVVYRGMEFTAERGQRIVLVGPNGAGKSTLLKLLAGVLPVQQGTRTPGMNVRVGYYAQHRVEMLRADRSVLDEALDTPQQVSEEFVRTVLGSFLFRGDDVFKRVGVLSGGEKSRLALVKLLLDPPNLLLMDEPTTHLDMASIDALIRALDQFQGTLIFISHDVYFIRQIARHVLHVNDGVLTHFHGDYQYYLDKSTSLTPRTEPVTPEKTVNDEPPRLTIREQKRLEAEARQARSRALRDARQQVTTLETEIVQLEETQATLTGELESPATYDKPGRAVEINRQLKAIADRLTQIVPEWETAATRLAELESTSPEPNPTPSSTASDLDRPIVQP
jgi:ATP-binding cassette subfamily F protein 3